MEVKPWLVVLVIVSCFGAVGAYAITEHGLPVKCYKDNQVEIFTPGGKNKAVSFHFDCRETIFGLDFGPWGIARTGIEFVAASETVPRHGFPPAVALYYERLDDDSAENIPPPVKIKWLDNTTVEITHPPDVNKAYEYGIIRQFELVYKVSEELQK